MPFATLASLPVKEIFGGTVRGYYTHMEKMTVGEILLKAGTVVPMHNHPHEQLTYVIEGRFEFTVGTETRILESGVAAIIPGGVMHGGKTLTAVRVLDVFAPVREDYRG
ncbi:MAG: cupin protein [Lacunisphaera sp.]|nr:cupin protein [Lacunisphaera sp.]